MRYQAGRPKETHSRYRSLTHFLTQFTQTVTPDRFIDSSSFPEAPSNSLSRLAPLVIGTMDSSQYAGAGVMEGILIDAVKYKYLVAQDNADGDIVVLNVYRDGVKLTSRFLGVGVKSNGDYVVVDEFSKKFYTYSNGVWDSGISLPDVLTGPHGIAVNADDDVLVVGLETDRIYTYSNVNNTWNSGLAIPAPLANRCNSQTQWRHHRC